MATYTPNYSLPLYEESDIPNLLDEYNQAITSIDAKLKENADGVSLVNTGLSQRAPIKHDSAQTTYGVGSATNYGHVKLYNDAGSQTDGAITPSAAQAAISSALSGYATDSDLSTQIGTRAPTNHASTGTTYGVGNSTNYGHVKLYNASGAQTDGAITPYAVTQVINSLFNSSSIDLSLTGQQSSTAKAYKYSMGWFKLLGTVLFSEPTNAYNQVLTTCSALGVQAPSETRQLAGVVSLWNRNTQTSGAGNLNILTNGNIVIDINSQWTDFTLLQFLIDPSTWA